MYLGFAPLMKTAEDKKVGHLVVSIIILIVVYFVIAAILTTIFLAVFGPSVLSAMSY